MVRVKKENISMRIISLILFALLFTLGGFCARQPDTPPGQEEGASDTDGTAEQSAPTSASSPTEEGQKEKVCQFKKDHVTSDVSFSGPEAILAGSDVPKRIVGIIDEGGYVGFWKDLSKRQTVPGQGGVVLPYEYTGEEYSDWCPSEGECIVEVVYRGADENAIYKKEKTHPRAPGGYYVYKGNITLQILFAGQVLDFSGCN